VAAALVRGYRVAGSLSWRLLDPNQLPTSRITEDIITELPRFRSLLVIARNSSFQVRDKAVDMKRVRRELGSQYLVEGSLRHASDQVRVTA
jgi:TolB-like protein